MDRTGNLLLLLRLYGEKGRNGLLEIDIPARFQDNIDYGYAVTIKWKGICTQN